MFFTKYFIQSSLNLYISLFISKKFLNIFLNVLNMKMMKILIKKLIQLLKIIFTNFFVQSHTFRLTSLWMRYN